MSRRFGRQQKRKLTEELTASNTLADSYKTQRDQSNKIIDDQKRVIDGKNAQIKDLRNLVTRTGNILGPYFIGLEAKTVEVDEILNNFHIRRKNLQMNDFIGSSEPTHNARIAVDTLEVIRTYISLDDLMENVHVKLVTPDGDAAIAISRKAWNQMDLKYLTGQASDLLSNHIMTARKNNANKS